MLHELSTLTLENQKVVLLEKLRNGEVTVTFTKVDGTTRVMKCTLDPKLLPSKTGNSLVERKENDNVIRVFSVDQQEWRSFRINSVISVD
jgi:hypothetical protein